MMRKQMVDKHNLNIILYVKKREKQVILIQHINHVSKSFSYPKFKVWKENKEVKSKVNWNKHEYRSFTSFLLH